ncbi:MAG: hypothetical protein Q9166_004210 [cf. Caloplaca sp. 2 TL-2023]
MPGPLSAIVGKPPLTADDKLIVHGFQVLLGMGKKDPSLGLTIAKKPPPPGQPHSSDTVRIAVGCAISLFLMAIFTGTRLFLRATHRGLVWGWDDWAMILATISTPSYALFYVAVAAIKISIVLFYMRLTAFTSRGWMWAHRIFIVILTICAIITLFITVFQCDPPIYSNIREIGRRSIKPVCLPLVDMTVGFSVWHIVTDACLLVVPFMMLWRVQMKWTTKLKVCIAGIIGFANVGLSIGRVIAQATARQQPGFDLTYTATFTFGYSVAELTLGVFTANLPVLSIVVTKTVEMLSWSSVSSNQSPDRGGGSKGLPRFHKRRIHDEPETEFGSLRGTERAGGQPTVRHDVEYGSGENVEVQETGPGKLNSVE